MRRTKLAKVVLGMKKTREFQTLLYTCTQEGCPLCRAIQESIHRYLDTWKYELFTDVGIRQQLRQTKGFCHVHTWQLVRMGATLPIAQAYRDILTDTIEDLHRGNVDTSTTSNNSLFNHLFDNRRASTGTEWQENTDCPACRQRTKVEARYIEAFRKAIADDEFYARFEASTGLCLQHFRLAYTCKLPNASSQDLLRLRQAQLACLQRLDAQLGELIRKHDYRFKDEPRGVEMTSWKRIAGLVAGEE
jgi:Family of unknown function (DUF6062)